MPENKRKDGTHFSEEECLSLPEEERARSNLIYELVFSPDRRSGCGHKDGGEIFLDEDYFPLPK